MNHRPTLRAVVTESKVETEFGNATRKDHIGLGRPNSTRLADYLGTEFYCHDSNKIILDHEMFGIENLGEDLKEQFEEDGEIIEKIKEIALQVGIVEIEVIR